MDIDPILSTDDWYTPPELFQQMDVTFDIDVCAPPSGVPWIPATKWFTENDDGLAQQWEGFVWCNPPYSDPSPWLRKLAAYADGIILIRADLSSAAYYAAFEKADVICVPRGRLQFVNAHGGKASSVTFTTILLGFGRHSYKPLSRIDGCARWLSDVKDLG